MADDDGNTGGTGTDDNTGSGQGSSAQDGNLPDPVKQVLAKERKAARDASKRATDLEAELNQLRQSTQSDAEKQLEAARKKAVEEATGPLQAENLRLKVAIAKQLPVDLVDRLRGSTENELAADADKLLELVGSTSTGGQQQRQSDPDQGRRDAARGSQGSDMNAWMRGALGRRPT